jgi:hypothetical protein
LKGFLPLVATPCYGGMVCINYAEAILALQKACAAEAYPIEFHLRRGESLVTRCRNDCVAVFLANPRFTHLFFIDADIGFTPEAAFRLLLADVAARVHPLKRETCPPGGVPPGKTRARFEALYQRYTVNAGREGKASVELSIDRDGFMEVREAPTGFMCIKRQVFDRLIEAYPDMRYVPDWPKGTYPEGGVHYRFFDVMVDPESRRFSPRITASAESGRRSGARFSSTPIPPSRTRASASIPAISPPRFAPRCRRRSARPRANACTSPGSRT